MWTDRYSPRCVADSAWSREKRQGLTHILRGLCDGSRSPHITLLHGPTGCGKLTTLRALLQQELTPVHRAAPSSRKQRRIHDNDDNDNTPLSSTQHEDGTDGERDEDDGVTVVHTCDVTPLAYRQILQNVLLLCTGVAASHSPLQLRSRAQSASRSTPVASLPLSSMPTQSNGHSTAASVGDAASVHHDKDNNHHDHFEHTPMRALIIKFYGELASESIQSCTRDFVTAYEHGLVHTTTASANTRYSARTDTRCDATGSKEVGGSVVGCSRAHVRARYRHLIFFIHTTHNTHSSRVQLRSCFGARVVSSPAVHLFACTPITPLNLRRRLRTILHAEWARRLRKQQQQKMMQDELTHHDHGSSCSALLSQVSWSSPTQNVPTHTTRHSSRQRSAVTEAQDSYSSSATTGAAADVSVSSSSHQLAATQTPSTGTRANRSTRHSSPPLSRSDQRAFVYVDEEGEREESEEERTDGHVASTPVPSSHDSDTLSSSSSGVWKRKRHRHATRQPVGHRATRHVQQHQQQHSRRSHTRTQCTRNDTSPPPLLTPDALDTVVQTSQGDVRQAILQTQWTALMPPTPRAAAPDDVLVRTAGVHASDTAACANGQGDDLATETAFMPAHPLHERGCDWSVPAPRRSNRHGPRSHSASSTTTTTTVLDILSDMVEECERVDRGRARVTSVEAIESANATTTTSETTATAATAMVAVVRDAYLDLSHATARLLGQRYTVTSVLASVPVAPRRLLDYMVNNLPHYFEDDQVQRYAACVRAASWADTRRVRDYSLLFNSSSSSSSNNNNNSYAMNHAFALTAEDSAHDAADVHVADGDTNESAAQSSTRWRCGGAAMAGAGWNAQLDVMALVCFDLSYRCHHPRAGHRQSRGFLPQRPPPHCPHAYPRLRRAEDVAERMCNESHTEWRRTRGGGVYNDRTVSAQAWERCARRRLGAATCETSEWVTNGHSTPRRRGGGSRLGNRARHTCEKLYHDEYNHNDGDDTSNYHNEDEDEDDCADEGDETDEPAAQERQTRAPARWPVLRSSEWDVLREGLASAMERCGAREAVMDYRCFAQRIVLVCEGADAACGRGQGGGATATPKRTVFALAGAEKSERCREGHAPPATARAARRTTFVLRSSPTSAEKAHRRIVTALQYAILRCGLPTSVTLRESHFVVVGSMDEPDGTRTDRQKDVSHHGADSLVAAEDLLCRPLMPAGEEIEDFSD